VAVSERKGTAARSKKKFQTWKKKESRATAVGVLGGGLDIHLTITLVRERPQSRLPGDASL